MKSMILLMMLCVSASADTLSTVALTLWGEARGESFAGKYAVASTIWNRAKGKPANLAHVCTAPKQFSCWRNRRFTHKLPDLRNAQENRAWMDCVTLADLMTTGKFKPDTKATHYHEHTIRPYWAGEYRALASVGGHHFYR